MVSSISQPYGATNLDPAGAGDVQSAGTPVDPTVVGDSSDDAGAAFVVGDPGLAASADSVASTGASGAQANPLPPAGSSVASDATGSAVQLGGSLAGGGVAADGAAAAFDSPVIAGGLASGAVEGVVTGGGSAVAASSGAVSEAGTSGALSKAATFVSTGSGGGRALFLNEAAAGINSVVASAQTSNGNTLITLPNGATMTLIGVTKVGSTFPS